MDLYGVSYIGHPRLEKLIKKNNITDKDFLSGKQEAEAFDSEDYIKLHQSTLRKVDILANILGRADDGSLKTNAQWHERCGWHPKVIIELIREHWIYGGLSVLTVLVTVLKLAGVF